MTAYSIDSFIQPFERADDATRPEVAERWLETLLRAMPEGESHPGSVLHAHVSPYMHIARQMVWAIPADSAVFKTETVTRSRPLIEYFNTRVAVQSDLKFDHMPLVRDMWLQPKLEDRRCALLRMTKIDGDYEKVSARSAAAQVAALAAWDVAVESGMDAETVGAATQLTLWMYPGRGEPMNIMTRHPLLNTVQILLARCDASSAFPNCASSDQLKGRLAMYPAACAHLLSFIERRPKYINAVMHAESNCYKLNEVVGSLTALLPGYADVIVLGAQLGLSYREVLNQVIDTFNKGSNIELPQGLSI